MENQNESLIKQYVKRRAKRRLFCGCLVLLQV